MNNLEKMIANTSDFKAFARSYAGYISQLLKELDIDALAVFQEELAISRKAGNTVFIIGNGGSAATASHMANDLGFGVRQHPQQPFRVMSLTDNASVLTAVANDVGYDNIFVRQLQLYFRPGDSLIVISASGNSSNLIVAAQWVKAQGGKVLGLLGFDGGKLKEICEAAVVVRTPKGEYGPVEDIHMVLDHLLHAWIWTKARAEGQA